LLLEPVIVIKDKDIPPCPAAHIFKQVELRIVIVVQVETKACAVNIVIIFLRGVRLTEEMRFANDT
jgi:hypothetical protein